MASFIPISIILLTFLLLTTSLLTTAAPTSPPSIPSIKALLQQADLSTQTLAQKTPLPPSLDPWYRAPPNIPLQSIPPGTVLKIRPAPGLLNNNTTPIPNALYAYQLLYRSTNSLHDPTFDVTTLLIPLNHARCSTATTHLCAHALLSYQLPYDTCNVDASPSYALQHGYLGGGDPYGEISDALSLGWFVSVPDYEGPLASYAAGTQAGHATLDGVRAVLQVAGFFGLRMDIARVALWGYSGGALASEWAAELAGQYAPKLKISGIALGGLTPNVTSVTEYINGRACAGLIPAGLLGIASQHPDAYRWIVGRLKPAFRGGFLAVRGMTAVQAIGTYRFQNIYDYFVGGEADLKVRVVREMYNLDGFMGYHGVPRMPVFVYKAVNDELSSVEDTDRLVERFCGVGANILYHRNLAGNHNQELVNGRQRAFAWLTSILDGSYWSDAVYNTMGCEVVNVTYNIAPYFGWWKER